LTISHHFCSGELVNSSIIYKASNCGHEAVKLSCCEQHKEKEGNDCAINQTKGCCDYQVSFVKVENESQQDIVAFKKNLPLFITVVPIQYLNIEENSTHFSPKYFNYKPPLLAEDNIEVLLESFLC
jgi:hypothetical protein